MSFVGVDIVYVLVLLVWMMFEFSWYVVIGVVLLLFIVIMVL